jgi:hypothetical protein
MATTQSKEINLSNISQAVASAEEHERYAAFEALMGNSRQASRHLNHAKSIMREVMRLTKPAESITDDELLMELKA